jgi:hypothetical protein
MHSQNVASARGSRRPFSSNLQIGLQPQYAQPTTTNLGLPRTGERHCLFARAEIPSRFVSPMDAGMRVIPRGR